MNIFKGPILFPFGTKSINFLFSRGGTFDSS